MILGAAVDPVQIVVGFLIAIPTVAGAIQLQRRNATQIWKDLYEAKVVEGEQRDRRMTRLEAKVDLLESNFVQQVAKGVAEAALQFMEERHKHDG
jgi:hypothetical protein